MYPLRSDVSGVSAEDGKGSHSTLMLVELGDVVLACRGDDITKKHGKLFF